MWKGFWWQISCLVVGWTWLSQPVCHGHAFPACQGSGTVKGFYELPLTDVFQNKDNATTIAAACCDSEGNCYGGLHIPKVPFALHDGSASFVDALQSRLHSRRLKRDNVELFKEEESRSLSKCHDKGCVPDAIQCCQYNLTVFFPVSAISLTTGNRVTVVQLVPQFVQPVIFSQCTHEVSNVLDGTCQQVLIPSEMYVATDDRGDVRTFRDHVWVDHSCECKLATPKLWESDFSQTPSIDSLTAEFFEFMGVRNSLREGRRKVVHSYPFILQP